jgi:hypothetical protein
VTYSDIVSNNSLAVTGMLFRRRYFIKRDGDPRLLLPASIRSALLWRYSAATKLIFMVWPNLHAEVQLYLELSRNLKLEEWTRRKTKCRKF